MKPSKEPLVGHRTEARLCGAAIFNGLRRQFFCCHKLCASFCPTYFSFSPRRTFHTFYKGDGYFNTNFNNNMDFTNRAWREFCDKLPKSKIGPSYQVNKTLNTHTIHIIKINFRCSRKHVMFQL